MNSSIRAKAERGGETKRLGLPRWMTMFACACLVCCLGCGYPEVSPKVYEITKALYSVCNLKRDGDLDKVTNVISKAATDSELSDDESEWLLAIVQKARNGEWEAAAQEAHSILKDQVDL